MIIHNVTDRHHGLLACPFCGGEAKVFDANGTKLKPAVSCKHCMADMPGHTVDKAVAAWNTRSPPPVAVAAKDLVQAVDKILFRRAVEQKLDGYTAHAAVEIATAVLALLNPTPDEGKK